MRFGILTLLPLAILPFLHGFEANPSGNDLVAQVRLVVPIDLVTLILRVVYLCECEAGTVKELLVLPNPNMMASGDRLVDESVVCVCKW